jgi:hypothetical protein
MRRARMIIHYALWRWLKGQFTEFRDVSLVAVAPVFYRCCIGNPA